MPSIIAKGALFLPMENAKIASIDVGDLAEVAATVLTNPGHEGKIYPLTGPEALIGRPHTEVERFYTEKTLELTGLLVQRGVAPLPRGMMYLSTAHTDEHIALTLQALSGAIEALARTRR